MMARTLEVRLTDDLDGRVVPRGRGRTIRFAFDGEAFEIDLSDKNAAEMRRALAPYIEAARSVSDEARQSDELSVTPVEPSPAAEDQPAPVVETPIAQTDAPPRRPASETRVRGAKKVANAGRGKRAATTRPTTTDPDPAAIKEWARANGYQVKDRGRLPNEVKEAFAAAV